MEEGVSEQRPVWGQPSLPALGVGVVGGMADPSGVSVH